MTSLQGPCPSLSSLYPPSDCPLLGANLQPGCAPQQWGLRLGSHSLQTCGLGTGVCDGPRLERPCHTVGPLPLGVGGGLRRSRSSPGPCWALWARLSPWPSRTMASRCSSGYVPPAPAWGSGPLGQPALQEVSCPHPQGPLCWPSGSFHELLSCSLHIPRGQAHCLRENQQEAHQALGYVPDPSLCDWSRPVDRIRPLLGHYVVGTVPTQLPSRWEAAWGQHILRIPVRWGHGAVAESGPLSQVA